MADSSDLWRDLLGEVARVHAHEDDFEDEDCRLCALVREAARALVPARRFRVFARIRDADVECPRCGNVTKLSGSLGGKGTWSPREQRWHCGHCGQSWHLGVVYWPRRRGRADRREPPDTIPSLPQVRALRLHADVGWSVTLNSLLERARARSVVVDTERRQEVNLAPTCTCAWRVEGNDLWRRPDPACKRHEPLTWDVADLWGKR